MDEQGRKAIGVGIIGLSATRGWAANAHLPALRALPDYEVRALSASSPESAKAAADKHEVAIACADHEELVARDDVDLVVVTVKVPEHLRLVSAAIDAGKAVLCEWPLANGLVEAEDLAARAERRGLPAFVGLQARSAPPVRALRELVSQGAVGEVLSTTLIATGDQWGPSVEESNRYLVDRRNGATLLTIPFGHTIDAVCHVLGEFASVAATTATRRESVQLKSTDQMITMTAEDQIAVSGTLSGGAVVSAHYRGGRCAGTNFLWEINGTEGDVVVRGQTGHLQYGRVEVLLSDRHRRELEPYGVPDIFRATSVSPDSVSYTVAEAYADIARALRGEPNLAPTFVDAVHRHVLLDAVQQAAATGRRQEISAS